MKQEARLPHDKLQKCNRLLHDFYKRRKVTLNELQSLLGLLNFTCSVFVPGRAFLHRMIDLTKGARRPHHHLRLTKEVKHDIAVWLTFLGQFNGRTFFLHEKWETSSSLQLYTGAAGSKGYGAIFGKHWFCGAWPDSCHACGHLSQTVEILARVISSANQCATMRSSRSVS